MFKFCSIILKNKFEQKNSFVDVNMPPDCTNEMKWNGNCKCHCDQKNKFKKYKVIDLEINSSRKIQIGFLFCWCEHAPTPSARKCCTEEMMKWNNDYRCHCGQMYKFCKFRVLDS
jgi:hypothetical protein